MKRQFTGQSSWYLLYICNRGPHCSRPTVIPLCTSPRTNSKSKQERRGVPPLAETAVSAPLKVPPPRQKKTSAPLAAPRALTRGAKNTFQVLIFFRP